MQKSDNILRLPVRDGGAGDILRELFSAWKKQHTETMKRTEESIRRGVNWREAA